MARSALAKNAGNFGRYDFPSLRIKWIRYAAEMAEQAVGAMEEIEKQSVV